MAGGRLTIEIQRACAGRAVPEAAQLERWLELALGDEAAGSVTLRIVDEAESADLNARYRGKSGPTNVLSFPAGDWAAGLADETLPLGDVVLCAPVVEREAAEQGKAPAAHWAHIVIHGGLHLAGYDHVTDAEAELMESRERELLAGLGIEDPYRAPAG